MPFKLISVVGARPQFIKAAPLARAMEAPIASSILEHFMIHTGQHYDENMSAVFFDELAIPVADVNLGVAGGSHGSMTGAMLAAIEAVLVDQKPDALLVYGDTNSTLAGALAAAKLHIPVVHVEAGLRSFNRRMPEEVNRVLTDHVSSILSCPTRQAVENLEREGITAGVEHLGDVMLDIAILASAQLAPTQPHEVDGGPYYLATCHRQENTDDPARLRRALECMSMAASRRRVVWPLHPRTRQRLDQLPFELPPNVVTMPPVGYLEMLALIKSSEAVLTDSGGVQKEAYFMSVPCITMRPETEWTETVDSGWNALTDVDPARVRKALEQTSEVRARPHPPLFGDGNAAARTLDLILDRLA